MTHEENWDALIEELRAYVLEHHHFPNKHIRLLNRVPGQLFYDVFRRGWASFRGRHLKNSRNVWAN